VAAASRRAQRRRSRARVMRVVATDRAIVAARIAAMAHGGKCAGAVAGGGSGGTGVKEGVGGEGVARAAGARPMAAVRQTASSPIPASVLGMRGGCAGACWWFIGGFLGCLGGRFSGWPVALSVLTPQRVAAGIALGSAWTMAWNRGRSGREMPLVRAARADNRVGTWLLRRWPPRRDWWSSAFLARWRSGGPGRRCRWAGRGSGRCWRCCCSTRTGSCAGPAGRGRVGRGSTQGVGHHIADQCVSSAPGAGAGPVLGAAGGVLVT
jgi:hypothetical protein